jgi:hypothetical protein
VCVKLMPIFVAGALAVSACSTGSPAIGSRDSAPEASALPTCSQTLAVGCMNQNLGHCPSTWDAAIVFCVAYAADYAFAQTDCGAYRRWHVENVDVGCSYYYDKTSGDLVAVFCTGATGNTTCLGGPSGLTEPSCPAPEYNPCVPTDAGSDGVGAANTD